MIDLATHYGENIFNRGKSQKIAGRVERYGTIVLELLSKAILSLAVIKLLNVTMEYAFIIIFVILFVVDGVAPFVQRVLDIFNYKLFTKRAVASEIRHYLKVFGTDIDWSGVSKYDDYLYASAFNPSLSVDLRILAAINWSTVREFLRNNPQYNDRFYFLFQEIRDADREDTDTKNQTEHDM